MLAGEDETRFLDGPCDDRSEVTEGCPDVGVDMAGGAKVSEEGESTVGDDVVGTPSELGERLGKENPSVGKEIGPMICSDVSVGVAVASNTGIEVGTA